MILIHSTRFPSQVEGILREGIRGQYHKHSHESLVFLLALEEDDFASRKFNGWGSYHFVLHMPYIRAHSSHFTTTSRGEDASFDAFLDAYSIRDHSSVPTFSPHQLLSSRDILVEGIEALFIPHISPDEIACFDAIRPSHIRFLYDFVFQKGRYVPTEEYCLTCSP